MGLRNVRRLVAYLNAMISDALRFRGHRMAAEIGQREMLALISASERYLPAPMTSGAKRWPGKYWGVFCVPAGKLHWP